jgi:hypothetical protein
MVDLLVAKLDPTTSSLAIATLLVYEYLEITGALSGLMIRRTEQTLALLFLFGINFISIYFFPSALPITV